MHGPYLRGFWLKLLILCVLRLTGSEQKSSHIRRFGFTKALLCLHVMSPLHRSELLVCTQCDQALVVWFGRTDHHLVLRRSLWAPSKHRIVSRRGHG